MIADQNHLETIQHVMADQKLVIADGHHRYETALNYRDERRASAGSLDPNAADERSMMTFVNTRGQDLVILAGHRVVANVLDFSWSAVRRYLEPWFASEVFPFASDSQKDQDGAKFLAPLAATSNQATLHSDQPRA